MATVRTCDHCSKRITKENPVIAKLFSAPVITGKTRSTHSNYTAHMDIGQCCAEWLVKLGMWQKRQTNKEQHNGRRLRPADPLAAGRRGSPRTAK